MKGARGYFILAVIVGTVVIALHAVTRGDPGRRNLEIFTEMVYSKANESFTHSSGLPGGVTMQHLVPGVVARGMLPLRFGEGEEEALRAGRELSNPILVDDASSLEQGRVLFGIYCALCHDPEGGGMGPAVLRGMTQPPSLKGARAMQMQDGQVFHILTYGQGNMASYAAQLSVDERWKVIRYLRTVQQGGQR